jgi:diguanylate cyclase (GGDEF)-like protein
MRHPNHQPFRRGRDRNDTVPPGLQLAYIGGMSFGRSCRLSAVTGALLGAIIPAALFALRSHPVPYVLVAVASILLMSGFGALLGCREEKVRSLALTDQLTGLGNRRHFDRRLKEEIARARREGTPLSLLFIDVDRFKRVNDLYGHLAGDRVLQTVAGVLRKAFRETDVVCRYGGDEVAVIAPGTTLSAAQLLAERAGMQVSACLMPTVGAPLTLTVSIGASNWRAADGSEGELELIRRSDESLYVAKKEGRGRAVPQGRVDLLVTG